MISRKSIVRLLHWLGLRSGFSVRRARRQQVMRILMFHAVGREDYPVADFEAQLRFLRRHFQVLPLADIASRVRDQLPVLGNEVALTFDDGTRNNFTLAYPVLQRLGLPATFFVCPGLVDSHQWLWNHEARERLRQLDTPRLKQLSARWGASATLSISVDEIVEWMKLMPLDLRQPLEKEIRQLTPGFTPTPQQHHVFDLMGWEEMKTVDPAVVSIGSHSVTHPILSSLEPEALTYEIHESRRLIENNLGRPVRYFSYPNGANNRTVVQEVQAGYDGAVIAVPPGFVRKSRHTPHQLPRISIARDVPELSWRLHRPSA